MTGKLGEDDPRPLFTAYARRELVVLLLPLLRARGSEATWRALSLDEQEAWLQRVAGAHRAMLSWRVAIVADQVTRGVKLSEYLDGTYPQELHPRLAELPWAELPLVSRLLARPGIRQRRERRQQERLRQLRDLERYLASDKLAAAGFNGIPMSLKLYYSRWVNSSRKDSERTRRREFTRLLAHTEHLEDVPADWLDVDGGGGG